MTWCGPHGGRAYADLVRVFPRLRRRRTVHTITDALRPMSEDIGRRERRYLVSMAIRTTCFVLSIVIAVAVDSPWKWLGLAAFAGAVLLPYVAVIFANGGREPETGAHFRGDRPETPPGNQISSHRPEIGS